MVREEETAEERGKSFRIFAIAVLLIIGAAEAPMAEMGRRGTREDRHRRGLRSVYINVAQGHSRGTSDEARNAEDIQDSIQGNRGEVGRKGSCVRFHEWHGVSHALGSRRHQPTAMLSATNGQSRKCGVV